MGDGLCMEGAGTQDFEHEQRADQQPGQDVQQPGAHAGLPRLVLQPPPLESGGSGLPVLGSAPPAVAPSPAEVEQGMAALQQLISGGAVVLPGVGLLPTASLALLAAGNGTGPQAESLSGLEAASGAVIAAAAASAPSGGMTALMMEGGLAAPQAGDAGVGHA